MSRVPNDRYGSNSSLQPMSDLGHPRADSPDRPPTTGRNYLHPQQIISSQSRKLYADITPPTTERRSGDVYRGGASVYSEEFNFDQRVVERSQRRTEALDMRAAGKPYREIAKHFDVSVSTVHDWTVRALAELPWQSAEAVLKMELRRLDTLQASYWDKAVSGDLPSANWTVLKTWSIGGISDSIGLDGFGAKACGGRQAFSISMIG
jgi:hypothetical protein